MTKKNAREREEERNEPEVIDSQMLWLLMHTLRRNAARRVSYSNSTVIVRHSATAVCQGGTTIMPTVCTMFEWSLMFLGFKSLGLAR